MSECNSIEETYQKNKDVFKKVLPKRAKDYYENDRRLREQARDKCRNLSEEKNKREYGRKRYHNMSKEKKQLKEYQKITARLNN